ncbi:helix-turn-helix domain-containing protein [Nocardia fluminea]|uniref:helix-turn-helix domain-containing protein n=1 Tax=Nocardia fluminea TaxID=134984 RepID=UPI003D138B42
MTRRVTRGFDPARLRRAREEHPDPNLRTRAEVARLAGIGVSTLQHWENGTKSPQIDKLAQVCRALGIRIQDVVDIPTEELRLGDWRVRRGMLLPEVARRAGLSSAHVARLEAGQVVTLPDVTAKRLADALEISVDEALEAYERGRGRGAGESA